MYKIAIIGFGNIGFRYFQAIEKIKLKKKLFIIDKKKSKFLNFKKQNIFFDTSLNNIKSKIDLIILSSTADSRLNLVSKIKKKLKFKYLIIEKPLTQSPEQLLEMDKLLKKDNCWVNTDRRILKVYKFIKKKLNLKEELKITIEGNSWGICCNSIHYIDLFSFLSNKKDFSYTELKKMNWVKSKRTGFVELDNGSFYATNKKDKIILISKRSNNKKKIVKVNILNGKNEFLLKEKFNSIELLFNKKKYIFKNEYTSTKMIKILEKILKKGKSDLPVYKSSSKLYMPLILFFLNKWKKKYSKSNLVPIS